jgi:hypothetical protein
MLGLGLCCGCAASASAAQNDEQNGFHEYARNKIGLLRYCRDQALIGQVTAERAIKAIESALEQFPVSDEFVKRQGDRAETLGESGYWEANGKNSRADLRKVADLLGTTTAELCKEFAGQTKSDQKPFVAKQVPPKVAKPQAVVYTNNSPAAVKPVSAPTVSTNSTPNPALITPTAATLTPPPVAATTLSEPVLATPIAAAPKPVTPTSTSPLELCTN